MLRYDHVVKVHPLYYTIHAWLMQHSVCQRRRQQLWISKKIARFNTSASVLTKNKKIWGKKGVRLNERHCSASGEKKKVPLRTAVDWIFNLRADSCAPPEQRTVVLYQRFTHVGRASRTTTEVFVDEAKREMKAIKEWCVDSALLRTRETEISGEFSEIDCPDLTRQQPPTTVTNAFVFPWPYVRVSLWFFISNQIGCATLFPFHRLYSRNVSIFFLMVGGPF